jgi:glycogen debranching enzyme/putative sterol carrier protein
MPVSQDVSILEGSTFVVSDDHGDIDATIDDPKGLFHQDTRFLSLWKLTVDGNPLILLSKDDLQYFAAQFFLVAGTGTVYVDSTVSVLRQRFVGDGFHEDLTVLNHGDEAVSLELRMEAGADFADLFEVKDALEKKGEVYRKALKRKLVLGYRRGTFVRETWISASARDAEIDARGLTFRIDVGPKSEWTTCIDVVTARDGGTEDRVKVKYGHGEKTARPNMELSLEEWIDAAPKLETDWDPLRLTYFRSLVDLAALRFYPRILPGNAIPAAGLPWFMTIFGRDSLITSYQALPFEPELAETTLMVLAARQGRRVDDFRDEQPGKILHEIRAGELTAFEERPHSPYFGSADATPLFIILLDEVIRWTGNYDLARQLEQAARGALTWIDEYGDLDGDGYVEYERKNVETGLENQCWKDSWNSILFADGSMPKLPRATCEIQGYVYDAKMRASRLARDVWGDAALSDRLEREASELRARFNEDFFNVGHQCFALALDGDKRQVDSITSNIGHLLWSGIVDDDKVKPVVDHLLGPGLFSGWGVRTMAEGEGGYNPIAYHNGTVWPHDNSLIALGLTRYGFREEAARISFAMLEAAGYFLGRLPEAFAGYRRERTRFPVEYPTACSPQAWATGAPLALVRALLDLQPSGDVLLSHPWLPDGIGRLELHGIPGRWGRVDVGTNVRGEGPPAKALPPRHDFASATSAREVFAKFPERVVTPRMQGLVGRLRFDIVDAGAWTVTFDGATATVREGSRGKADCTLEVNEVAFLEIIRGERNPDTAFLQGAVKVWGDIRLAQRVTHLFADEMPFA